MIKNPIVAEIAYKTWCIDEYGMDAMFLLEGDTFSLLIDTGTGTFDLPALVKQYTTKPLIVALTHGHVDHAGGMHMFDTIYMHEADMEMAKEVSVEDRQNYVTLLMSMCGGIYDMDASKVVVNDHMPTLKALRDGNVIHLGNRDVYVYSTPGHTDGGMSYLDIKERILFSGDACNPNILLCVKRGQHTYISDVLESAKTLLNLSDHFDRHYNGHIGYADMISVLPLPESLIQDTIDLCEDLLEGKVVGEATENPFGGKCMIARNKTMQVQYYEDQIK